MPDSLCLISRLTPVQVEEAVCTPLSQQAQALGRPTEVWVLITCINEGKEHQKPVEKVPFYFWNRDRIESRLWACSEFRQEHSSSHVTVDTPQKHFVHFLYDKKREDRELEELLRVEGNRLYQCLLDYALGPGEASVSKRPRHADSVPVCPARRIAGEKTRASSAPLQVPALPPETGSRLAMDEDGVSQQRPLSPPGLAALDGC
jgi:hypothetical protein